VNKEKQEQKKKKAKVPSFVVLNDVVDDKYTYQVNFTLGDPITECSIWSKPLPGTTEYECERYYRMVSYGLGVRKHGDKYDQVKGMKCALASVFRKPLVGLSLDVRRAFWESLRNMFPEGFETPKPEVTVDKEKPAPPAAKARAIEVKVTEDELNKLMRIRARARILKEVRDGKQRNAVKATNG
jgi:hypothetical protein